MVFRMSKRTKKTESVELLAGGSSKKLKLTAKDPFEGRFGEMSVDIPDTCIAEVCGKLFGDERSTPRFEIKSYKSELVGVAKTVCGETRFIEESKVCLLLTYEKDKKDDMVTLLTECFPHCCYSFR